MIAHEFFQYQRGIYFQVKEKNKNIEHEKATRLQARATYYSQVFLGLLAAVITIIYTDLGAVGYDLLVLLLPGTFIYFIKMIKYQMILEKNDPL